MQSVPQIKLSDGQTQVHARIGSWHRLMWLHDATYTSDGILADISWLVSVAIRQSTTSVGWPNERISRRVRNNWLGVRWTVAPHWLQWGDPRSIKHQSSSQDSQLPAHFCVHYPRWSSTTCRLHLSMRTSSWLAPGTQSLFYENVHQNYTRIEMKSDQVRDVRNVTK
jgi:hypothetical protein